MRRIHAVRFASAAFLASTALGTPAAADSPAPRFAETIDDHGVDFVNGLPFISMVEGGIGSGPGRVAMNRIWAEGARFQDNWSGGLFDVTSGGVTKKYVQINGISDTFTQSGSTYTADKANGASLVYDSPTTQYFYTASDGTKITFSGTQGTGPAGTGDNCPGSVGANCHVPLSITEPNGLRFTIGWTQVTLCLHHIGPDCDSEAVYFRLNSVSSSAGYSMGVSYVTNSAGTGTAPPIQWYQRSTVTFNNSANPPSPAPTITYAYPDPQTVSVTDPASRTWTFTTDTSSRLTGVKRPGSSGNNISFGYGADGTVNTSTKDGVTNTYSRSLTGTIATETRADPLNHQRVVTADTLKGRPTSDKDELNRTTSYAYDTNARLTRLIAQEGNYVQYGYDARGNVTTTTNVAKAGSGLANIITSASFDATCTNIVKCNNPNSMTDAKGNVTAYVYDPAHGGVTSVTRPDPGGGIHPQARYGYTQVTSASGDLIYMLTGASACQTGSSPSCVGTTGEAKTSISYNSNLLPTSITRADGTGALAATTTPAYDARGRVDTVDGPLSTADITKYRWDNADQLIGITDPDPDGPSPGTLNLRAVRLTYRPDGQVSKREMGTVVDQTDPSWNNFTVFQTIDANFDTNSRPITSKLSGGGIDKALTQTSYDVLGRVDCIAIRMNIAVFGSLPSSACAQSMLGSYGPDPITQTVYDAASEIAQLKVGVGTSDAATERTLSYTNNGLVQYLIDEMGSRTQYTYDGFDRLSQTIYPSSTRPSAYNDATQATALATAGSVNSSDFEQPSYDANSNVTSFRTRSGGLINFGYDSLNRRIALSSSLLADRAYSYDLLDHPKTATFQSGGQGTTNSFDALGRMTSTSSNVGGTAHALSYQYDLTGRRTRLSWWDGFYIDYGRLVTGELSTVRANGATVLATYAYDDLRRRTSLTRGNGAVTNWGYDPVSRLATLTHHFSVTTSDVTLSDSYDPASRIVSQTRSNTAYSYSLYSNQNTTSSSNGLNQITNVGPASVTYDTNGNLNSDGTRTYSYDIENKLISTTGGLGSTSLSYDPLNRLDVYNPGTSTRFIYDGDEAVALLDSSGNITRREIRGDGNDEVLVEYNTSDWRYFHLDDRNSAIAWTDPAGSLASISIYDEYGIPAASNPGFFQYTGQINLKEAGLYSYKARMYSPALGRFMQTDPIGPVDDANLYAYVLNDPVNYGDPLGLGCNDLAIPPGAIPITARCLGRPNSGWGSRDVGLKGPGERNAGVSGSDALPCSAANQSGKGVLIELGYTSAKSSGIFPIPGGAHHIFVMAVDASTGEIFASRGGPGWGPGGGPGFSATQLVARSGSFNGRFPDYGAMTAVQTAGYVNAPFGAVVNYMNSFAATTNANNLTYKGNTQNSNSYAAALVMGMGLKPPQPAQRAPGYGSNIPSPAMQCSQ